jgi:hypothetical protein
MLTVCPAREADFAKLWDNLHRLWRNFLSEKGVD